MPNRNTYIATRYSFAVEKDAYRKRFDTSDAIIVPMVQKGKVEETILESVPQLMIQIVNTALLGQVKNMPPLTIFSISLSVISLAGTMWYYAYWNLFRCMQIRDVPSALSLYNYKLSGVKDGAFSFAKTASEVVDVELSAMERMRSVSISRIGLDDSNAGDEQTGQLLPKNTTGHVSSEELPLSSIAGAAEINAENSRLRAENAKLREEMKQENQQNQQMWAEINMMRLELQRLSSVALDSEDARAKLLVHSASTADAADGIFTA